MEKRIANFEYLRALSMLFIVFLHFANYGISSVLPVEPMAKLDSPFLTAAINHTSTLLIIVISSVAVNCYVLTTGYFMINKSFKLSRILKVWFTTLFYSAVIALSFFLLADSSNSHQLMLALTPIRSDAYWFVTQYIGLLILSPFLNMAVQALEKRKFAQLLYVLALLNLSLFAGLPFGNLFGGSFSLMWFIFLYLLAGYIRLYNPWQHSHPGRNFWLITLIIWLALAGKSMAKLYADASIYYNYDCDYNGFVVFSSVCLFLWFKRHTFKECAMNRFIARIAPYTFGVYLIHDNIMIREQLWKNWLHPYSLLHTNYFLLYIIGVCLLIFVTGISIDFLRSSLFRLCRINQGIDKFCSYINKKTSKKEDYAG